jgi:kumamolisin
MALARTSRAQEDNQQEDNQMLATHPGDRQLDSSLRPPRRGARMTGPVDPNETVVLCIVVRRKPGAPPLPDHQYWMSVAPGRRKFPSRSEFAAKYGAAPSDLDAIAQFCRTIGLSILDSSAARRSVVASATAAVVAKAFHVELKRYATPNETYRGHEGCVQLPSEIADIVEVVLGFDNRRLGTHASNGGPPGATPLTPIQVAQFYQFPLFTGSGQWKDATGQTIGILEFGGLSTLGDAMIPDFQKYFNSLGIAKPPQVITVPANQTYYGGGPPLQPDPRDAEVALDVEVAGAIAQGAKIVVYFGAGFTGSNQMPDELGWQTLVTTAITDDTNKPSILSISWGAPEADWPPGTVGMMQTVFQEAAAAGITVFAASGDCGASGYPLQSANYSPPPGMNVQYPASDPSVTGCGGTVLLGPPPSLQQQTWNDSSYQGGATGGGISSLIPTPAWQSHVMANGKALSWRGVPDVAGNASTYSGYDLTLYGKKTSTLSILDPTVIISTYAGTSAVAPLYAGLTALINANLFPSSATTQNSVGFLNPTLYGLTPTYASFVFQDIDDMAFNTFNQALGYQSVKGWDPCTGWGSINGVQLLETLLSGYVSDNPGCLSAIQTLAKALMRAWG